MPVNQQKPKLTSRDKKRENSRWALSAKELKTREILIYIFSDFIRYGYFFLVLFFNLVVVLLQSYYSSSFLQRMLTYGYPYNLFGGLYEIYFIFLIVPVEILLFYYEIKLYLTKIRKKIYGETF